jgi:hypothetical protein
VFGTVASASGASAGASAPSATTNAAPVFFLPQHHGDQDMANNGVWYDVRIANAHNGLSVVELWDRVQAPVAGYVYYKNLYDHSFLTAPSRAGGGVYTSPFQGSNKQMWKATLQHDLSYQLSNLDLGSSLLITYTGSSARPFVMSPVGAAEQKFYINPLATAAK